MSESVIVALIAGLCAAIPSIYATYKQSKQNKKTNEKLDDNDLNKQWANAKINDDFIRSNSLVNVKTL